MVHICSSFLLYVSFIGFSYGQMQFEGPVEVQRAFLTAIDLSIQPVIHQQTFIFTANDSDTVALYNISLNFDNGECVDPLISIEIEPIDNEGGGGQAEALFIFYPTFNNDSQIARCSPNLPTRCGIYTFCTEFEPPSGSYAELIFFIGTGGDISSFCEDDRSISGRVTVTCQADIGSLCAVQEEEGEEQEGSSSESRDNAMQEFGDRLTEQHGLENDSKHNEAKDGVVTFKFDENTANNLWIMFVFSVCFCCIAQCGFIYVLYNRK